MKISAKDEYGLRILLRIAKDGGEQGISIARLSEAEGISEPYVAKITRLLRIAGLIKSNLGSRGGYVLVQEPDAITINHVLKSLDGKLFDQSFCKSYTGIQSLCTNSVDCSIRSLWKVIQSSLDDLLEKITLADLMSSEGKSQSSLQRKTRRNSLKIREAREA